MTLPVVLATTAPVVTPPVVDPVPQGDPVIKAPTSQNLQDWSTGMAAQVKALDALLADNAAELSELDARRLKLVADRASLNSVRTVIDTYSKGAANWATVVKP